MIQKRHSGDLPRDGKKRRRGVPARRGDRKMKNCGVICEFNPFHNGHAHLLGELRERGAELIVCVMSGSFVQRGEPAICDKFSRAASAVAGGADLVFELPYPYSSSGAERFAACGVNILARLGVDTLGFGSECGDADMLRRAAGALMTAQFTEEYRTLCRDGHGSAFAYFEALRRCGIDLTPGSNDILAVSYLKAIAEAGWGMDIEVIKREGSGYNDAELSADKYPSATALRRSWLDSGLQTLDGYIPQLSLEYLKKAQANRLAPSHIENIERDILTYLRICDHDDGSFSDSLIPRIFRAAREASDYDELLLLATASNYTDARVRRTILDLMLRPTPSDYASFPVYTQLLAANARGKEYLKSLRRSDGIAVVTKPADVREVKNSERQHELNSRADALWCMTLPRPLPADTLEKLHPIFI